MLIRFTRGKKGDVLTCVREDGTTTWMRERPGFVAHDLAHYAVETEFGYDTGFFGLVAHGWELGTADFGRDPRSKERYPWPGGEQQPVGEHRARRPHQTGHPALRHRRVPARPPRVACGRRPGRR